MINTISQFPASVDIPVVWGEMDAFQHVNNVVYFRYFESARIQYFEQMQLLKFMETTGVGPILAATDCKYRIPLTFPDKVTTCARVKEVRDCDFIMEYKVFSHQHQKLAAEGTGRIVLLDFKTNQKVELPPELRDRIEELEREGNSRNQV
ncbi:MAG: thioesterase [SAR324 cluster bacterium]|uniref:Thioesterase n=1 Tax=SAR324 cluster bacterium TaxID=2024889 RepID=A0A2A4T7D8_9DELT|nr:MAG: thioesterase [SAR324 cluster bacterium]